MLYKPNFCCNCGEKIERREWNLLTSRRFCEVCSAENKKHELLPQVTAVAGVLAIAFGIGSIFGGGAASSQQIRGIREPSRVEPEHVDKKDETSTDTIIGGPERLPRPTSTSLGPDPVRSGDEQFALRKDSEQGRSYFCGAMTKKGTPCSRKVKKQGTHCWQHQAESRSLPEN